MRPLFTRFVPLRNAQTAALLLLSLGMAGISNGKALAADSVAAARANNTGVALMNQQLMEKALAKFEEARKLDPSSAIPALNQGIALLYLRKLPEAEEALKKAGSIDPNNVRVWYSLGLPHFTANNPSLAANASNALSRSMLTTQTATTISARS